MAAANFLVLAAIITEGTESDVKMRLNEGRQVLAPLIGILGTIVGFYFGQTAANTGFPQLVGPVLSQNWIERGGR